MKTQSQAVIDMLKKIVVVFNSFAAWKWLDHALQTIKFFFIKDYTRAHTFMHVRFCSSLCNSIKDTLRIKP